jgi:hypothetical protein
MSDKKLTPRVGDRVLVKSGGGSRTGDVRRISGAVIFVEVHGVHRAGETWQYDTLDELTVVDREPVEWPEGWEEGGSHLARVVGWKDDDETVLWFGRSELERILATGPDMLARWDELFGEA